MKHIPIAQLIPGMVTAQNILDYDLKIIVPKGIVLTDNIISRLEGYCVYYVNIQDDIKQSFSKEINPNISRTSPEFMRFYESIKLLENQFSEAMVSAYYKNANLPFQNLVAETIELMYQDDQKIDLFNMLLLLRNENDSVYEHCIDVALICYELAGWLGFSEDDRIMACACGLFHDAGKLAVPQTVLRKPGKLTPAEFEVIKTHTTEGFHILQKIGNLPKPILNSALMHHEKCDGSGYPYGVTGEEIDKFAKIVTIADVFDAMTSDRVYRKAMCPIDVIKHFENNGLHKYEPNYLLTFLENVSKAYVNLQFNLSNGFEGNVVFISSEEKEKKRKEEVKDIQDSYYQNILKLAGKKNVSIETII